MRLISKLPFVSFKAVLVSVCAYSLGGTLALAQVQSGNATLFGTSANSNIGTPQGLTHQAFDALLSAALNKHPTVSAAVFNAQGAGQDVEAAKWGHWPTVSVNASTTNTTNPDGIKNPSSVTVQQPIWSGGALSARVSAAENIELANLAQVEVAQGELAIRLLEVWANYLEADASRAMASRTLQGLSRYQGIMMRRVDGGLSSAVEQRLLSVRYLRAQSDLSDANAASEIALQRMEHLAGKLAVSTLDLKRPLSKDALNRWVKANHTQALSMDRLNTHPAVLKAQRDAAAAANQLSVQKSDRWPKLVLSYQHNMGALPANVERSLWQLGLNYTPGAGLSNFSQSAAEEARLRGLVDNVDIIRSQKQELLMLDWSNLRREIDRQEGLVATITSARDVLESYERQYFAGLKSWLDVLNALQELSAAEMRPTQAMNAATLAFYRWRINGGDLPTNTEWVR